MKNVQSVILVLVVAAALVGGGFLLADPSTTKQTNSSPSSLGASVDSGVVYNSLAPLAGNRDAKVKMVVFSDYLCPYCKQAHAVSNEVLANNPNASLQYRNLIVHENSRILAQAAEAANLQGKFTVMNDALFEKSIDTTEDAVTALAKELGLDVAKFKSDLYSDAVKSRIAQDEKDAVTLKLQGTPSFFVNEKEVDNFNNLNELVGGELAK